MLKTPKTKMNLVLGVLCSVVYRMLRSDKLRPQINNLGLIIENNAFCINFFIHKTILNIFSLHNLVYRK